MRVGIIGTRGVPATFGGIEHHVEEVGARLAERGHAVTVYCRANYVPEGQHEYKGMRLVRLPTVASKRLDATVHSALATAHALGQKAPWPGRSESRSSQAALPQTPLLLETRRNLNDGAGRCRADTRLGQCSRMTPECVRHRERRQWRPRR